MTVNDPTVIATIIVTGLLIFFLYLGTKGKPTPPKTSNAEKDRRERLREHTHKRRVSLFSTPGVDVYNPRIDPSEVIDKRKCPMCNEIPLKKCYYCGRYFCEKHRPPDAHNCPNR